MSETVKVIGDTGVYHRNLADTDEAAELERVLCNAIFPTEWGEDIARAIVRLVKKSTEQSR